MTSQRIQVAACDRMGIPYAEVPLAAMPELVEFLSDQTVPVQYQYHTTHFTVRFLKHSASDAQCTLDEFVGYNRQLQVA